MSKPVVLEASLTVNKHSKRMMGITKSVQPRERHPDEAMPRTIDVMGTTYKPDADLPKRPGADDHLKFKSHGNLC